MVSVPSASTRLDDESGGVATGSDRLVIFTPCLTNDDGVPRQFGSTQDIYSTHGYCQGLGLAALFIEKVKKPVQVVGLEIGTLGTVGRFDPSGNTGTSVVTVAAGSGGSMEEVDGILRVPTGGGGTIGTDQIKLELSLDGGLTYKPVRLGTASSYVIPYVNQTLSFAGGTLVAGDTVLTWHSTAPLATGAAITAAKLLLAAQTKLARRWILCGDYSTDTALAEYLAAVAAYETTDERYILAHASVRDRLPYASMSRLTVRMTGSPSLTFADVGGTGDTIVRSAGSWITDGFVAGDRVTVTGSVSNNITDELVTNVTADTLTLDDATLSAEGPKAGCVVTGTPGLLFAEVGASGDTITRSRGSWYDDGFRTGDLVTIDGTVSNDQTTTNGVTVTSDTVLTLGATPDDLVDEGIGANLITITAGETDAVHVAAMDAEMAPIDGKPRITLSIARNWKVCPITGWKFRRPAAWVECIEAYYRPIGKTTWEKSKGPLDGWGMTDANGDACEHDERTAQNAVAARFTCLRTWGNGPAGTFIAQALTRATDGSLLGMCHNMDVANTAQTICQMVTENFAGATLVLQAADESGKRYATTQSLKEFESKVNEELSSQMLSSAGGEGPMCSSVRWAAATDDDLGAADATLHGTCALDFNGTIVHIATTVKVS